MSAALASIFPDGFDLHLLLELDVLRDAVARQDALLARFGFGVSGFGVTLSTTGLGFWVWGFEVWVWVLSFGVCSLGLGF